MTPEGAGAQSPFCIACSIFRQEIERLRADDAIGFPVEFISSLLHLTPAVLDRTLAGLVARESGRGNRLVLAFGDCCGHMGEFTEMNGVTRTSGINCCEIILGTATYRKLRKEGAFFVMPEWAERWREVFAAGLGLNAENARDLMAEMHSRLIYLDTGQVPVPREQLDAFMAYTGLSLEILPVSLEPLLANFRECLGRMEAP